MNKIKSVKVRREDGSFEDGLYYLTPDADKVSMTNGYNVQETIGDINVEQDGDIATQLAELKAQIQDLLRAMD